MKYLINKLRRLDNPFKIVAGIGFPLLIILLVTGTTTFITYELGIKKYCGYYYNRYNYRGIDPFKIEESWWVWFITIGAVMLFEWMLFSKVKDNIIPKSNDSLDSSYKKNNIEIKKEPDLKIERENSKYISTNSVHPDANLHDIPSVTKPSMIKKSRDEFQSDNVTQKNNIFLDSLSSIEDKGEKSNLISTGNHPWRRYFARMVDVVIIGNILLTILMVIISVTFPELLRSINDIEQGERAIIFSMILFAMWVPVETWFLCAIGTTPAKWIFGISVTTAEGKKLNYSQAHNRSFSIWAKGLCFGIPFFNIFTLISSVKTLNRCGQTYWDTTYHTKITHKVWGVWRAIFSFLSVMAALLFLTILQNL